MGFLRVQEGFPKGMPPEPGKMRRNLKGRRSRQRGQCRQRWGTGSSMVGQGSYEQPGMAAHESRWLHVKSPAWKGWFEGL